MITTDYERLTQSDIIGTAVEESQEITVNGETLHSVKVATQPSRTLIMKAQNHHLALAASYIEQYEHRINQDTYYGEDRQRYEDAAYKQAMMHAAYAQAEAATRQAECLESLVEFVGDLVGAADLVNGLMQWSYKQKAG